jgi:hypothetical protein
MTEENRMTDDRASRIKQAGGPPEEDPRPDVAAARRHSEAAIETMVEIMRDPEACGANRLRAANWLLERAWGLAAAEAGRQDETAWEDIIASLGPRDPATPTTL